MKIREVFADDVTRDIPPVIYFHEQDPSKLAEEVAEYIVTGGYDETDVPYKRVRNGIHEQFVKLLKGLAVELEKPGGPELPASWISGFYGSGKSSFAKLLGLALDGLKLPDGRTLADALLERDQSPRADELRAAWDQLTKGIKPIAAVFDIGSVARDDEHVAMAAKRQVQARLRYCARSREVADYELRLERDGRFDELKRLSLEHLGKPWSEVKEGALADDDFSLLMHYLLPEHYTDPMTWLDARAGARTGAGTSIEEITRDIAHMLEHRAAENTLFLVVDEVSQYIHQHEDRQGRLQSFVSEIGKRLKGRVFLLCTGQQQLEDSEDAGKIAKLKDRFPERLRVHLEPSSIRDVVHKRLLRKNPRREPELQALFDRHKADLQNNAFGCETINAEDFLEVYPLLPEHVDLFMRMTSNLRLRSSRVKGDDFAIRGLLQTLGEMFREQNLAEQPLGHLVTLDAIYDVHATAFDVDTQNAMDRLHRHAAVVDDPFALKVAKAVAMLSLIQEEIPTKSPVVAGCLYPRLGAGNLEPAVKAALQTLLDAGLLSYSENLGFKLQSAAGLEWQRERERYAATSSHVTQLVSETLSNLMGDLPSRPKHKGRDLPWSAYFAAAKDQPGDRLIHIRDPAVVTVDFRFLMRADDRDPHAWRSAGSTELLRNRLIWVVGDCGEVDHIARDVAKSNFIVQRYRHQAAGLPSTKQRVFYEEVTRQEDLQQRLRQAVAAAFVAGDFYFRGRRLDRHAGLGFKASLEKAAAEIVGELYGELIHVAVNPSDIQLLLAKEITGPSLVLTESLGLLEDDAGRFEARCRGVVPTQIRELVENRRGVQGDELLRHFGGPPFGYGQDVVKACLAALLRGRKIRVRLEKGTEIATHRDNGVSTLFQRDRDLKRADILPAGERKISVRDRNRIHRLFSDHLLGVDHNIGREEEDLADAVVQYFPAQARELRELARRYDLLPDRPPLPTKLKALESALEDCRRSRQTEDTLEAVKRHFETLNEGLPSLSRQLHALTEEHIESLRRVAAARDYHGAQLQAVQALDEDGAQQLASVRDQLNQEQPWRDLSFAVEAAEALASTYRQTRKQLLDDRLRATESAIQRLKRRPGFSALSADQSARVQEPILECFDDTAPDDVHPELALLRDGSAARLERAQDAADRLLDKALAVTTGTEVSTLDLGLTGRELTSRKDVELLLDELRDRLLRRLGDGAPVRIRLL